jgi:hypothetical protein
LEDTGILVFTSICTSIADTGRFKRKGGKCKDNMKKPAAILVHNTGITSILPVSSSICNTGTDTGKY